MLYFITEGNNVRIKDGDNDFRVLHNTSNCINWTVYDSKIDLSIDEVTFDQMNPTHIYFDGVAASTSAGVVNSLKGMFSNLGSKAKVYRALLTQTGTDAPVATVLENTIGDIVWSRGSAGTYYGTLVGFLTTSNFFTTQNVFYISEPLSEDVIARFEKYDNDSVVFTTKAIGSLDDGWLNNTFLEFYVYP